MTDKEVKTWDAEIYSKNSSFQYKAAMAFLAQYNFKGGEEVLDIGCGDGKITFELSKQISQGKIIGVDASDNMISYAKKTYADTKNLSFEHIDAQSLSYKEKFDVIVSNFCLQWVPDKQLAFNKIAEALKSKGDVLLIMPMRNNEIAALRAEIIQEDKWKNYFQGFSDSANLAVNSNYQEYATKAGIAITQYETEKVTTFYENIKKLEDFLLSITANVSRLPTDELKRLFISDLASRYIKVVPANENGEYSVTYTCIKLVGKRI